MSNHIGNASKMVSDTPRTDAAEYRNFDSEPPESLEMVDVDFARQLERELNTANDRIKRLEEAGQQLLMWLGEDISESNRKLLQEAWRKAKEDKP